MPELFPVAEEAGFRLLEVPWPYLGRHDLGRRLVALHLLDDWLPGLIVDFLAARNAFVKPDTGVLLDCSQCGPSTRVVPFEALFHRPVGAKPPVVPLAVWLPAHWNRWSPFANQALADAALAAGIDPNRFGVGECAL
jgi:hypothetical protein